MSTVHEVAVSGFGEGTNDLYDRARPSYPSDALQKIHDIISESSSEDGWKILEPGSGTGIFSRLLIAPPTTSSGGPVPTPDQEEAGDDSFSNYPQFPIDTLISIEPSEGMRNQWNRSLLSKLPPPSTDGKTIQTVPGSFDNFQAAQEYGVNKGEADAVIIAQAWHWCPDHEAALTEIASYLKPGAPLILIWNLEAFDPTWQAEIREAYQKFDKGSPQYYKGWWKAMYDTKAYKELFQEKVEWKTRWSKGITEDQLVDRLFSKSYLTSAHLSASDRGELEGNLRGIIRSAPLEWVDKANGVFKYAYDTDIVYLRKKA
ncbi:uncharacterized protein I303_100202 [Kwoniella dejecticola CBS 10117]|uniref:Methyltransferase type 11 domain-containing protein n=1 Tax=Kwoniella dejecticola CBS 10117 TaxID=1296121 RepID=A0A1A6AED7_9TREE|nr:uncharacterized protein I303_00205 [Kwoniella dejecticola CBS 10117]OBR88388.1 hypothetical protein I303_00205 [Kwoniella dejecticola CBS 10117]